jgi:heme exporter protein D
VLTLISFIIVVIVSIWEHRNIVKLIDEVKKEAESIELRVGENGRAKNRQDPIIV